MKDTYDNIQNEQEQQENRLRLMLVIDRLIEHVSFPLSLLLYMSNKCNNQCALLYNVGLRTT